MGRSFVSSKNKAIEIPTSLDIAWAAGIYEGEGSVDWTKTGPDAHTLRCQITQKETWILEKIKRLFGGNYHRRKREGYVCYDWKCHGARARGFLQTIFLFLSPHRQAQVLEHYKK